MYEFIDYQRVMENLITDRGGRILSGNFWLKDGSLPDPASTDNAEFKCILQLLKDSIPADKTKYSRMAAKCKGVSEETTTGVHRLKEMAAKAGALVSSDQRQRLRDRVQVRRRIWLQTFFAGWNYARH